MAYIIGNDNEDKFTRTQLHADNDQPLKAFFARTRIAPNSITRATWFTGTPIPPEVVPTKARIVKGDVLYDWCGMGNAGVVVSARFKDCVDELDPGRHGFFPLTVEDQQGSVKPGSYFLFNVVGRIEAIIEAQSNLKASGRGQIEGWSYTRRVGPWKCALDASVIGDRACWTDRRWGGVWFISDRLAALLRERGLMGFGFKEYCEEVSIRPEA